MPLMKLALHPANAKSTTRADIVRQIFLALAGAWLRQSGLWQGRDLHGSNTQNVVGVLVVDILSLCRNMCFLPFRLGVSSYFFMPV